MSKAKGWRDLIGETRNARVLIVDDDPEIRSSLERLVTREGHSARVAASAEAADVMLSAEDFDVCLLDVDLPRMNGPEFLKWALARDPLLAVIMVTGINDPTLAIESIDQGARTYLVKPIQAPFVLRAVRDAVAVRSLLAERNRLAGF